MPGATVYVEESRNPARKTKYDLIAVEKGRLLINMDSQAPNKVAAEYLPRLLPGLTALRPETTFGSSRFDFYAEARGERWFVEVKGVTLEEDGAACSPTPPQRGVKHLQELCRCVDQGYRACVLFVVQMKGVRYVAPNQATHGVCPGPPGGRGPRGAGGGCGLPGHPRHPDAGPAGGGAALEYEERKGRERRGAPFGVSQFPTRKSRMSQPVEPMLLYSSV